MSILQKTYYRCALQFSLRWSVGDMIVSVESYAIHLKSVYELCSVWVPYLLSLLASSVGPVAVLAVR